jgi:hypothetical protein
MTIDASGPQEAIQGMAAHGGAPGGIAGGIPGAPARGAAIPHIPGAMAPNHICARLAQLRIAAAAASLVVSFLIASPAVPAGVPGRAGAPSWGDRRLATSDPCFRYSSMTR